MWRCHYCREPLSQEVQRKNRLCPNCGSDLHCCRNCVHYDEKTAGGCREPHGPWVADRATQNDCEYFEFRAEGAQDNLGAPDSTTEAEQAKQAFRALFRTA